MSKLWIVFCIILLAGCIANPAQLTSTPPKNPTEIPTAIATSVPVQTIATETPSPFLTPSQPVLSSATDTATPILQTSFPVVTITPSISNWKTYTSQDFHISLKYPGYWQVDNTGSAVFSGDDGFFQLTANGLEPPDAQAACEREIQNNNGKEGDRYGSKPTLEILQVDNQPACLVYPSIDQSDSEHGLALLEVVYPNSVREHAILDFWADKDHIRLMITTLKFIR